MTSTNLLSAPTSIFPPPLPPDIRSWRDHGRRLERPCRRLHCHFILLSMPDPSDHRLRPRQAPLQVDPEN